MTVYIGLVVHRDVHDESSRGSSNASGRSASVTTWAPDHWRSVPPRARVLRRRRRRAGHQQRRVPRRTHRLHRRRQLDTHRAGRNLRPGPRRDPIRHDEQAVAIANDSDYGLVAGLWTNDVSRAIAVSEKLRAGQVFVNTWSTGSVQTPFGGWKSSGYGREKGIEALHHYSQVKCVTVKPTHSTVQ